MGVPALAGRRMHGRLACSVTMKRMLDPGAESVGQT